MVQSRGVMPYPYRLHVATYRAQFQLPTGMVPLVTRFYSAGSSVHGTKVCATNAPRRRSERYWAEGPIL